MRKLSLPIRILLAFISFLLGVALFASVVVTALIADIQITLTQDTIQSLVLELISEPAHIRPNATGIPGQGGLQIAPRVRSYHPVYRSEAEDVASDLTDQLIDMFYDQVVEQLGSFPVEKEQFKQMIEDSTVTDYISEKTAGLITDYINDTVTTTFEPEEIVQLIEENAELIESITGEPIPEDIADQVAQVFDENEIIQKVEAEGLAAFIDSEDMQIPGLELEAIPGLEQVVGTGDSLGVRDIINAIRAFASRQNLIVGIVICVVLMAAILLVNAAQLPKGFRRAGYPLLWAGLPVVVNLLAIFAPDLWTLLPGMDVAQKLFQQTAIVNIIVFGTGFVLVLVGIILAIVFRVRAKIIAQQDDENDRSDEPVEIAAQVFDVNANDIIAKEVTPTEEPAIEAPVVETPVVETPAVEVPIVEEPVTEEPTAEEPAAAEAAPTEETPAGEVVTTE